MKSKTLSIISLSILAVLVLTAFASAIGAPDSVNINKIGTTQFEVTYGVTETIGTLPSSLTISDGNGHSAVIGFDSVDDSVDTVTITAEIDSIDDGFFYGNTYSANYVIPYNDGTDKEENITINFENTPIEYKDDNALDIEIDDLSVVDGFGPEDDEWYLMDKIKAKIKIEANKDMEDVSVEWGLYDLDTGNWIIQDEEKKFDLDDGDKETVEITFQLDEDAIDEIDLNSDSYVFYVWATGEDKDDSDDKSSVYASNTIDLKIDDNFVVVNNIEFEETASCGNELHITADVWNIGSEDQDDVYVIVYNKALGINQKVEVGDIDALENEQLEVTITIPEDADEKQYDLIFRVYDEDNDLYENDEDDKAEFFMPLTLSSCSTVPTALVTATLDSEARAGNEIVIKVVITNTGSETKTFTIGASDYASWASSAVVDKTSLTLDAGEFAEVTIKLNANKDASGENQFDIEVLEGNKFMSQPVIVNIEGSSFLNLTGFFTGIGGNNWYLWGIGALNIILVLIIIIVAAKMVKPKKAAVHEEPASKKSAK